ncbi:MAG: biotin--[acetyl-CoA-carboxylase] ligase [Oscillospiraceae bacterium]
MLKDEILHLLERRRGEVVSGGELAKELGVSRTAVWKAIHTLEQSGAAIETLQGAGYRLAEHSDALSPTMLQESLSTRFVGRSLELLPEVDSTSNYLKRNASEPPNGHVAVADRQTGGRGRLGRSFVSPEGSVYLSVLLKPEGRGEGKSSFLGDLSPAETQFLTICAAVAVCRALKRAADMDCDIKWVNDVFWGGKKICGILTEASINAELQSLEYAVVGIGINMGEVPEEIAGIATSVWEATGRRGLRAAVTAALLEEFEKVCLDFVEGNKKEEILRAYEDRLFVQGREVLVTTAKEQYRAVVAGVDADAALLVKRDGADITRLVSGEITLL